MVLTRNSPKPFFLFSACLWVRFTIPIEFSSKRVLSEDCINWYMKLLVGLMKLIFSWFSFSIIIIALILSNWALSKRSATLTLSYYASGVTIFTQNLFHQLTLNMTEIQGLISLARVLQLITVVPVVVVSCQGVMHLQSSVVFLSCSQ